jgi:hypothetical protein
MQKRSALPAVGLRALGAVLGWIAAAGTMDGLLVAWRTASVTTPLERRRLSRPGIPAW